LEFFAELCQPFGNTGKTITSPQGDDEEDEEDAMDEDVDLSSVNDGDSQSRDEDVDLSSVDDGDSQSCDEDSAMRGDNCAPVSNL